MLLDWIFPPRCLHCRRFLKQNIFLCEACAQEWPSLSPPFCSVCARPFHSAESENHVCGECLTAPKFCARVIAAGIYRGVLHDMMIRFKYRAKEEFSRYLGGKMVAAIAAVPDSVPDLIVPAPLHPARLRERGYNQANLLAREIGRVLRLPVDSFCVRKVKKTLPQAELRGDERRKNLAGAFELKRPEKIAGKDILLVDDVYTTGTTVETLAELLLKKGARKVEALVLARAE